tara:strand:- start:2213 stop:2791 length:579 start_codon:yes stop_codon:yes gene_type:complete
MADCTELILAGISLNCDDINAAIGVDKDLILVNYSDFDRTSTLAAANIEADNTNGNIGGLSSIILNTGAIQYTFEGTDYSIQPSIGSELKEDGNSMYVHTILFTSYSKSSASRNTLIALGNSRVIAITRERSTGLYELFGANIGLKISGLGRAYVGAQTSNFYQVTIATPDVAVIRETSMGLLSLFNIVTNP